MRSLAVFIPLLATTAVNAICPGFNFGISNAKPLGGGVTRWDVYDSGCNVVDGLTTNQNPCTRGIFSCTPAPITFNGYINSFTHLQYACRPDPNSGSCGGGAISVCCRNDGG